MGRDLTQAWAADYLKAHENDDLATKYSNYAKLTGSEYDPLKTNTYYGLGKNLGSGDLGAYRNLFHEVTTGGWKGGKGTGEYVLNADPTSGKFGNHMRSNAETAAMLKDRLFNGTVNQQGAYGDALAKNLFSQNRVTDAKKLAELGDAGLSNEGSANYWVQLHNNLTGEDHFAKTFDPYEEHNFWRKYKEPLIQGAAGVGGFLIGGPAGAVLAASLAGTARDAYEARVERRKVQDAKRDWDNAEAANQAEIQRLFGPHAANLFRGAGEGVVDWSTADVGRNKHKDTYVRNAT